MPDHPQNLPLALDGEEEQTLAAAMRGRGIPSVQVLAEILRATAFSLMSDHPTAGDVVMVFFRAWCLLFPPETCPRVLLGSVLFERREGMLYEDSNPFAEIDELRARDQRHQAMADQRARDAADQAWAEAGIRLFAPIIGAPRESFEARAKTLLRLEKELLDKRADAGPLPGNMHHYLPDPGAMPEALADFEQHPERLMKLAGLALIFAARLTSMAPDGRATDRDLVRVIVLGLSNWLPDHIIPFVAPTNYAEPERTLAGLEVKLIEAQKAVELVAELQRQNADLLDEIDALRRQRPDPAREGALEQLRAELAEERARAAALERNNASIGSVAFNEGEAQGIRKGRKRRRRLLRKVLEAEAQNRTLGGLARSAQGVLDILPAMWSRLDDAMLGYQGHQRRQIAKLRGKVRRLKEGKK